MNITQSAWLMVMVAVASVGLQQGQVTKPTQQPTQQPPVQTQTK